ncbi:MAG: histidine kinase [Acidobacteriota bacterium]|nr:histidine kinase [Acidobacteriota bacterium]
MPDIDATGPSLGRVSRSPGFQDLMPHRVQNILLVSSLYESFILAQDGQLNELILSEYLELNLRNPPRLRRVSTGAAALAAMADLPRIDLVIASVHVGDMHALTLARLVKASASPVPVVLLAYDYRELQEFMSRHEVSAIDRVFLWQGDARILLTIIKHVEDRLNVAHDTGRMGVQAIIVIEDNVRFYSSFLPVIYTEVLEHAQRLLPEALNLAHKLMRAEARPKILHCGTFEEAWQFFSIYEENILGVISDIEFPNHGAPTPDAGVEFARLVRARQPDVPVVLQSSSLDYEQVARAVGASFLQKGSPMLLHDLRRFMVENFGFGDFIFRRPDGTEVGRAHDLMTLEEQLRSVPEDSVVHHAERNHFSRWLKARTEFAVAHRLRPRTVQDFPSIEHLRQDLINAIREYRQHQRRGVVADFDRHRFDPSATFARIGGGSLGGKARGLAFMDLLLAQSEMGGDFQGVDILIPPSVVIGTDVFDEFLDASDLRDFAVHATEDEPVVRRFLAAPMPESIRVDLAAYLDRVRFPLAVRSSSLLEDSQYQPFAGVYRTCMLANSHTDAATRLRQLLDAIKRVWASTFSQHAKAYLDATPYRLEEEKMAVVLQRVVGAAHQDRFYPSFAGVARSHNFYPVGPMRTGDGIAAVALGLGEAVVGGRTCVRFCPRYPQHLVQFSSTRDMLQNSQRAFHALSLRDGEADLDPQAFSLAHAEADGTLAAVGSTYSAENDAVYDGTSRPGVRLVSFAPVLKHDVFPLAQILHRLLAIGVDGTSTAVEMEFAVRLPASRGERAEFGFLQLRPLALSRETEELDLGSIAPGDVVCQSTSVLGHGRIEDLRDVVVVDIHRFDRARSSDVAREVARFNDLLGVQRRRYVLIGVGRWGSAEPYLGIPVGWEQISGARVIVESGFKDFSVTPSQGTHFFQNLSVSNVGYFTVNPQSGDGYVDWDWLAGQVAEADTGFVRHLRLPRPVRVIMNGARRQGVVLKPTG